MHIKTLNRDIELQPYTRGMDKKVKEKMMEWVVFSEDGKGNFPAVNVDKSEELAVSLVSGLSLEEIDSLSIEEYDTLKEAVNVKKNTTKK